MYVCVPWVCDLWVSEDPKGLWIIETKVTDSCGLPCGCGELSSDLLEQQEFSCLTHLSSSTDPKFLNVFNLLQF